MRLPWVYPFKSRRSPGDGPQDDSPHLPTGAEKNIAAIIRLEQDVFNRRSPGERIADSIAAVTIKPWFILAHVLLFALWIVLNTTGAARFDAQPFNLLNTIITLEAIFLTLLVLASQRRMSRIIDRRAHLNLQVDLLAEQEMTVVLRMLEGLFQHFHLDPVTAASQAAEMRKMTDLDGLVKKIANEIAE